MKTMRNSWARDRVAFFVFTDAYHLKMDYGAFHARLRRIPADIGAEKRLRLDIDDIPFIFSPGIAIIAECLRLGYIFLILSSVAPLLALLFITAI